MEPTIKVTITTGDKRISEVVRASVDAGRPYKYLHSKILLARLRMAKQDMKIKGLTEEEQAIAMRNIFIIERNVAAYAAEQYAQLNQEVAFNDLNEIVSEIDELLEA